jgi:hypothetical protein
MYIGERRTTFAKANGIEVRCCWELFVLIPPSKNTKRNLHGKQEKREAPSLHDAISHWLHGNSIPKMGCH